MLVMSVQSGRAYRTEVSYPIICTYMLLQSQRVSKHLKVHFCPKIDGDICFLRTLNTTHKLNTFFPGKVGTAGIDS